jgi:hypothetical protein
MFYTVTLFHPLTHFTNGLLWSWLAKFLYRLSQGIKNGCAANMTKKKDGNIVYRLF